MLRAVVTWGLRFSFRSKGLRASLSQIRLGQYYRHCQIGSHAFIRLYRHFISRYVLRTSRFDLSHSNNIGWLRVCYPWSTEIISTTYVSYQIVWPWPIIFYHKRRRVLISYTTAVLDLSGVSLLPGTFVLLHSWQPLNTKPSRLFGN